MILAKAHKIFYDRTGIEISIEVDRALRDIVKMIKADKKYFEEYNKAMFKSLVIVESPHIEKGIVMVGTGTFKCY